jgi:cytidylate kinase
VIAIDGPTASGKGTIAHRVADELGFHYLDSGAIYRLAALQAVRNGVAVDDDSALGRMASQLPATFVGDRAYLDGVDVGDEIRTEEIGNLASRIAVGPALRQSLLARQQAFSQPPGLVADGRDMGSVVFPHAALKVFLTATATERAERRYKQLMEKGIPVTFDDLLQNLIERDRRDTERVAAPLKPAKEAWVLDSTHLSISEVVNVIIAYFKERVGLPLQMPRDAD